MYSNDFTRLTNNPILLLQLTLSAAFETNPQHQYLVKYLTVSPQLTTIPYKNLYIWTNTRLEDVGRAQGLSQKAMDLFTQDVQFFRWLNKYK